jgi:hypothetical protein
MGIKDNDLETTHNIKITRDGVKVGKSEFRFEPATQKIPTGLWGDARVTSSRGTERLLPPEANEQQFLDNTQSINVTKLQYDIVPQDNPYAWKNIPAFGANSALEESRKAAIKNSIARSNPRRNQLLESLCFNPSKDVRVTESVADAFVIAPQVKS